ncbi:acyl-CoA-binding domain-containing protein 5 [Coccinella septempunctata]|uniref:acyl-CoA-binding domain-containing protein 5 n=1 Tax=Coccinella septempunctata TaxID=41139 RepID=UPI001D078C1C|nr:acyl-CoA-binding domain-containing protein 5 [Coccinella septempunctata]
MTTEQKFEAAVNVIRSLPKNGSYQPSNDLLLRFYAFYKQATEGPCLGARPAFWDIVNRAKYDAWKRLGNMSRTEAMVKYIDELHSIVETLSYSDKVANFLEASSNELESISMSDLELIAGDVLQRVRSQTNSPISSRDASPTHISSRPESPNSNHIFADDESDEEYIDTIEAPEPRRIAKESLYYEPNMNGILQKEHVSRSRTKVQNIDISLEVSKAVQSLQLDIESLRHKVQILEKDRSAVATKNKHMFGEFSPALVTFIVVWPFLCTIVMNRFLRNK